MGSWLKGFGLFALIVAAPFLVERLLGRHGLRDIKFDTSYFRDAISSYGVFGIIMFLVAAFFIVLFFYIPEIYRISDWLTLAEREMTSLMRGWGGGMSTDGRRGMADERGRWLTMIPDAKKGELAEVYKEFFSLNQTDLATGGPQAGSMGKARITAFLLREIYEGRVENAQLKVLNEVKSTGKSPFIAPGVRQILGFDHFDEKTGFPPRAGVSWFPLIMAVKLNRHPRHILMVKPDKTVVTNWAVIDELNRQAIPAKT